MKKLFLAATAFLVLFPLTASADLIGTGNLTIAPSYPVVGDGSHNYLGDYDVTAYTQVSGATITFGTLPSEAFCVSDDTLSPYTDLFGFYSATEQLEANAEIVTWIANWATTTLSYTGYSTSDDVKGLGQGAIWQILGVIDGTNYKNIFTGLSGLFTIATDKGAHVNEWLVAVNPYGSNVSDGYNQDFLVKATAPVPEPATTFLIGIGVAGLAAVGRRKKA